MLDYCWLRGAKVNQAANDGVTPLHVATQAGHAEVAALLFAKGAAVNRGNNNGFTPLYTAATNVKHPKQQLELERKRSSDEYYHQQLSVMPKRPCWGCCIATR